MQSILFNLNRMVFTIYHRQWYWRICEKKIWCEGVEKKGRWIRYFTLVLFFSVLSLIYLRTLHPSCLLYPPFYFFCSTVNAWISIWRNEKGKSGHEEIEKKRKEKKRVIYSRWSENIENWKTATQRVLMTRWERRWRRSRRRKWRE